MFCIFILIIITILHPRILLIQLYYKTVYMFNQTKLILGDGW